LTGHKLWVQSVAFSPDGRRLASGSHDNTIKVWDPATGQQLQELDGHKSDVESVAFSRDGQWIASGSADRTIKLWGRYQ
jgi:WD40 repeat protein